MPLPKHSLPKHREADRIASARRLLMVLLAVVLVLTSACGRVADPAGDPASMTDEQLMEALAGSAYIDGMDSAQTDGMELIMELLRRADSLDRQALLAYIRDPSVDVTARSVFVDVLTANFPPLDDDAMQLIKDAGLDADLRVKVLVGHTVTAEHAALLEDLMAADPGVLSFHALKKLGQADPEAATRVAWAILDSPTPQPDDRVSAAYDTLVRVAVLTDDQRTDLIARLAQVINAPQSGKGGPADSAVFALAELRAMDAIREIVYATGIDQALVVGAVDQNAAVLLAALQASPDEPTIRVVVDAMRVLPILEIAPELKRLAPTVADPSLRADMDSVITHIESEGVPLNPKWTEDR